MSPSRRDLPGARIVIGVTGGIAAYKAADLVSKLVQAGADVQVVMTQGALAFVQPMTFQALTRRPVHSSVFEGWNGDEAGHVTIAAEADLVLVAPATADAIAKAAHGLGDDMLGAVLLATRAPILLAPAMEHHMWHHPATQANLATLETRGVTVIPPEAGRLASGASGVGRLPATSVLLAWARRALNPDRSMADLKIVVTAGGTQEAIDPVRFVGNRSSGQMGIAIAQAAWYRGADVTLICGPTVDAVAVGVNTVRVESALDMQAAVDAATNDADVLVMAAAVADFRPASVARSKIKKQPGQEAMQLDLVRNPDILAEISREGLFTVGFAAETDDLVANAKDKLKRKGLDMIVANDAVQTIGSSDVNATILAKGGGVMAELGSMPKAAFAEALLDAICAQLDNGQGA